MRLEIWFNGTSNQDAIMRCFPGVIKETIASKDDGLSTIAFETKTGHQFLVNMNNVNFIEFMENED